MRPFVAPSRAIPVLAVMAATGVLAGCAPAPDYPALLPTDAVLAEPSLDPALPPAPAAVADPLLARASALDARADALRGPVVEPPFRGKLGLP